MALLFTLDDGGVCDGVKGQFCCFCFFFLAVLQGSSPDIFSLKNLSIIFPRSFLVFFFFSTFLSPDLSGLTVS